MMLSRLIGTALLERNNETVGSDTVLNSKPLICKISIRPYI